MIRHRSLVTALLSGALALGAGTALAQPSADEFEAAAGAGAPSSPTLDRAGKAYDRQDYFSASIELQKVLSGESKDDPKNVQRAQFMMGKTLYNLGFFAGALKYFNDIATAGEGHSFFRPTLKWLAALSRKLPETSGILEKIGTYDEAALDDPSLANSRDELRYLLGRHFYKRGQEGDFTKAVELFRSVSEASEFYLNARFFEGVTHVREFNGEAALEAFKAILKIGRERPAQYKAAEIDRFEKLAILQMARVFYSSQQYDTSIKYFEKLDQDSPDWTTSLFEASWAYFMKTNNSKALGNIHTLNAPYFEDEFFPESVLLKAVIYFEYCLYDRALEAVAEFDAKYKPLRANIDELLAKYEDNGEFYEYIKKVKAGTAGLEDELQRLVLSALSDRTLQKEFEWVDELQKELDMLAASDKTWQNTGISADVLQELTLQKSLADSAAGKVARDRIERLARELRTLSTDGRKIQFEILKASEVKLTEETLGTGTETGNTKDEPIVVDDEHFMWKFNGEYWKDELGYYRFRIRSQCPKKKK